MTLFEEGWFAMTLFHEQILRFHYHLYILHDHCKRNVETMFSNVEGVTTNQKGRTDTSCDQVMVIVRLNSTHTF